VDADTFHAKNSKQGGKNAAEAANMIAGGSNPASPNAASTGTGAKKAALKADNASQRKSRQASTKKKPAEPWGNKKSSKSNLPSTPTGGNVNADMVAGQALRGSMVSTGSSASAGSGAADKNEQQPNKYRILKKLGQGAYSKVYLAEMSNGDKVAVKAITKARLKKKELASILKETEILAKLNHPNVITYIEHFEDAERLYIVTEFAEGGELFERVVQREYYEEADVRKIMRKLLKTVQFCHENGIVHRDIKPENILLASKTDDDEIRLADFGFAREFVEENFSNMQTACGTPGYVAPEVISQKPYDRACDVWSLGVVAYILLCGYPPFRGTDRRALFHKIRHANYEFDSPWWDPVSKDAKDFVSKMLVADPQKRSTIPDLLGHPFLASSMHVDLSSSLEPMREWNAKRKVTLLRNAVQAMIRFKAFGTSRKSLSDESISEIDSHGNSTPRASLKEPVVPVNITGDEAVGEDMVGLIEAVKDDLQQQEQQEQQENKDSNMTLSSDYSLTKKDAVDPPQHEQGSLRIA